MVGKVNEEGDLRLPFPHSTTGSLFSQNTPQTFARTKGILGEGMCGGPVISEHPIQGGGDVTENVTGNPQPTASATKVNQGESISASQARPGMQQKICGLVEGIVPMDYIDPNLRGLAGFIPSHEISRYGY